MIIVTGGAGFIGSAFVSKLNSEGIKDILVVDCLRDGEKWRNLNGKRYLEYVNKEYFLELLYEGDFAESVEAIVHMGACSSTTEKNADYMMSNNFAFTKALAEWALDADVRFIYASSAATYGAGEHGYDDSLETIPSLKPLNIYGYSKQLFDQLAIDTTAHKKMVGLKFFNVYGPNEYHKGDMASVVYKAYHQIKETSQMKLFKSYNPDFKDGEFKRDFVYIKDCVDVIWWLLNNKKVNGIFNLGTGRAQSWNDLANGLFAAMDKKPKIEYIEMPEHLRAQYQYFTEAKMDKLTKAGCKVKFRSLEDGIKDYVQNHLMLSDPYL